MYTHVHGCGAKTTRNPKMACPGNWKHGNQNLRFAPPIVPHGARSSARSVLARALAWRSRNAARGAGSAPGPPASLRAADPGPPPGTQGPSPGLASHAPSQRDNESRLCVMQSATKAKKSYGKYVAKSETHGFKTFLLVVWNSECPGQIMWGLSLDRYLTQPMSTIRMGFLQSGRSRGDAHQPKVKDKIAGCTQRISA